MRIDESKEYLTIQKSLTRSWNTYNNYSILSHVRMSDGLALSISVKEYKYGRFLGDALIGRKLKKDYYGETEEIVHPGLHSYSGKYTEAAIRWRGIEFTVESTFDGDDIYILISPKKLQQTDAMLVLKADFLWNRNGYVYHESSSLVSHSEYSETHIRANGKESAHDYNIPLTGAFMTRVLDEDIVFYTGKEKTIEEIKKLIRDNRREFEDSFDKYGELKDIYKILETNISWNTTYDARNDRVATPTSRIWSIESGGYVMYCWDSYFCSLMAGLGSKDIAYANFVEITKESESLGFVPNVTWGNGFKSVDRSQPPVGSFVLLNLYKKYRDEWFLKLLYPYMKKWNDWFYENRRNPNGTFSWGSNKRNVFYGTKWEYAGVNDTYGAALESGMDNSPMYDDIPFDKDRNVVLLEDVGLTGLFIFDSNSLMEIALILNYAEDVSLFKSRIEETSKALDTLWSEEDGIYLNRRYDTKEFSHRLSPTLFYSLFDKNISKERALRMMNEHYFNKDEFHGEYVIPTISRNDSAFSEQYYWRGRIWAPVNFLVYIAFRNHEELSDAKNDMIEKSYKLLMKEWNENRHVHENYNAITGEGCDVESSDRFYHWGALLGFMRIIEGNNY